jgi:hypothetical protein
VNDITLKKEKTQSLLQRTIRGVDEVALTWSLQSTLGLANQSGCDKSITTVWIELPTARIVAGKIRRWSLA